MDRTMAEALRLIADDLSRARADIRALRPNDLRRDGLPAAGAELDAIVKDTEAATETIMTAAEALLAEEPAGLSAYKTFVEGRALAVIEACAFQDITGQRISKVVSVLREVEVRIGRLADSLGVEGDAAAVESAEQRRRRDQLLHGPALDGHAPTQAAVDALFNTDPDPA